MLSDTLKQALARYTIGEKVRALRWQRKMRLVELADRTGLSPALLSKIERGNSIPSIASLCLIAAAFDLKLSFFFPKASRWSPAITRKCDRVRLPEKPDAQDPAYEFESLNFPVPEAGMYCYRAEFHAVSQPRFHMHEGLEFVYLASGELVITLMDEICTLHEGDSLYFDSGVPHAYSRAGTEPCIGIVISCPAVAGSASLETESVADVLRLRTRETIWRRAS